VNFDGAEMVKILSYRTLSLTTEEVALGWDRANVLERFLVWKVKGELAKLCNLGAAASENMQRLFRGGRSKLLS
jgi:hypothetical protein